MSLLAREHSTTEAAQRDVTAPPAPALDGGQHRTVPTSNQAEKAPHVSNPATPLPPSATGPAVFSRPDPAADTRPEEAQT
jgi:hypothetical protein